MVVGGLERPGIVSRTGYGTLHVPKFRGCRSSAAHIRILESGLSEALISMERHVHAKYDPPNDDLKHVAVHTVLY